MTLAQTFLPIFVLAAAASAQWLDYPTKGIPRAANGKADLTAPTPRTPEGHPDITGLWVADNSRQLANLAADLKEVPFQHAGSSRAVTVRHGMEGGLQPARGFSLAL